MRVHPSFYNACLASICLTLCLRTQPALGLVTVTVTPANQVVVVGSNVVFNAQVSATGGELVTGYTWQVAANGGGPYTPIPNATTATLNLPNIQTTNTGYYFAQVTYSVGTNSGASASAAVSLVVLDQARVVSQPQGGLIRIIGTNASFSVSALGAPPLGYQWRLNGANLANGSRITGATGTTLSLNALVVPDTGSYDVVVTNAVVFTNLSLVFTNTFAATSQVATLSVFAPPGISIPPQSTNVILGSNVTFSVTASGTPPLSFQWQMNGTNLSDGPRISGSASNLLTISATVSNDTGGYSVLVTNPVGSATSSVATLTVLVPAVFTSATNVAGRQGAFFSFTNTAVGTLPITFGVTSLPAGLLLQPTNGVISGTPTVTGVFNLTLYATNAAMTTTGQLVMTLTTGIPGITSAATASGKQGNSFTYTITASNGPTLFAAAGLPAGLNLNSASGAITGAPLVSGTFPVTLGAANQYGGSTQMLTLTLSSAVPVITSARTATGTENQSGFIYTIKASNTPTQYGALGLPAGLFVNPTNGVISGTPWYGGVFTVPLSAINAWGTGTTNLVLTINYATLQGLAIADVTTTWSTPYVLDFSFSLRDGNSPTSNPVVLPPSQLQVVCMEDGLPVADPSSENPYILQSVMGTGASKQLKTFLVLDYTYSMFAVSGAIDAMQAAAELLINEEPAHAMFAIVEFHADDVNPQFVTNSMTTTNNYFITDKTVLSQSIQGIQANYVKGDYAGTRCWDAIYAALSNFGTNNPDEQRYVVAMTDGNDDSSLLNTNADPISVLVSLAQTNHVAIYCVAFGNNINTNSLQELTSQTSGHYYTAATTSDLAGQFQLIQKDVSSQYSLRWATLKRAQVPPVLTSPYAAQPSRYQPLDPLIPDCPAGFQPSFQITYSNLTASWNTDIVMTAFAVGVDTNSTPADTNYVTTNLVQYPFNPPDWSNDVHVGSLRLVQDADIGPQTIRLRSTYTPRYVREVQLQYRPNYPCTAVLDSTDTNGILFGWTMTDTTDTNGLHTLTMLSSNPTNQFTSIPYAAFGDLVEFDFTYPDSVTSTQAFSVFTNINLIYSNTNMLPTGQSFTNQNFASFITVYPQAPPHGTPIPWLNYYGFKTNYAAAELITTNGLPVWEDYLAGLNPTNASSRFYVWTAFSAGQTPQIMFTTVSTRTYRVEAASPLGNWLLLLDNIPGTGGNILFIDNRNLSGVNQVYYRVAVH